MADPKTNYTTEEAVNVLLEGLDDADNDSVSDTLMASALNDADDYIDEEVGPQSKTDTPNTIAGAAKYKAGALIYRQLYKNSDGTNPTAVSYEKEAARKLKAFIGDPETEDEDHNIGAASCIYSD